MVLTLVYADGIIPAYAGNTAPALGRTPSLPGSSPHTRGTRPTCPQSGQTPGDHPRIRGEHEVEYDIGKVEDWIIPACAGNTFSMETISRICSGSSPHTRGTRTASRPARAAGRDHPRIRGEHKRHDVGLGPVGGIIPAYAGNTDATGGVRLSSPGSSPHTRGTRACGFFRRGSRKDHPRIRGEHVLDSINQCAAIGIIPAYAGNTIRVSPSRITRWDHPRIRGEHQPRRHRQRPGGGIIPAYAGNTTRRIQEVLGCPGSSPHTRGTP